MPAQIIHAPNPYSGDGYHVFLAGSIEMGKATDWQRRLIDELKDLSIVVLNPRRPDWDSSWKQTKDDPQFRQQVEWELQGLGDSHLIVMYLAPGTMSPISLLELGLYASRYHSRFIICCPEGFWRKGNVDIVAERYGIPVYDEWAAFVAAIKAHIIESL